MSDGFEAVIGLEVHAQLATESKLFCGCRARPEVGRSVGEERPNVNTCEICAGHPGVLPAPNRKAVEYAVKAGLALGCTIRKDSVFARKQYFYPDLPRGYQISQYDQPICENGQLEIDVDGVVKKVRIERIHMEEDAGKNVHHSDYSLVNLNRAGVPLIEIVTKPDLSSAEEAGAYLRELHAIVTSLEVCDGNMQEGNFRCDANVSVRPKGQQKLGTRVEIKNVNSFRFIEKAIDYEISRQIEVIHSGGRITQETRSFDSTTGRTESMRSKEEAQDYRYFPDADLLPLRIEIDWINSIRDRLPELPAQKRLRFVHDYQVSHYDAKVLTSSASLSVFFDQVQDVLKKRKKNEPEIAKVIANLLTGEVSRLLNEGSVTLGQSQLKPDHLADLAILLRSDQISSSGAKVILARVWENGGDVGEWVSKEGLSQVNDLGQLESIVETILKNSPVQVEQYRAGKDKVMTYFVGQAMKETKGKGNPQKLQEIFRSKLSS